MSSFKDKITKQAVAIIGSTQYVQDIGNKLGNAEKLAALFIDAAIEEVYLSVNWKAGIKQIPVYRYDNQRNANFEVIDDDRSDVSSEQLTAKSYDNRSNTDSNFKNSGVTDCIKVIAITPSSIQWYVERDILYFQGDELNGGFYYSSKTLDRLLNEYDESIKMPAVFINLCALYVASNIAHALYCDSVFTDGLQKQYSTKIEESKKLYFFDYYLTNSARFG